jgi:hypothetical protein
MFFYDATDVHIVQRIAWVSFTVVNELIIINLLIICHCASVLTLKNLKSKCFQ